MSEISIEPESREKQVTALKNRLEDKPRLFTDSTMTPEVKNWVTGEEYVIESKVTQIASRKLEDGTVQAEFTINSTKSK